MHVKSHIHLHVKCNRLQLEEERDALKTKCLRGQSSIAELRTCLQHEKNGISVYMSMQSCSCIYMFTLDTFP